MIHRLATLFDPRPRTAEGWLARMGRPRVSARDQADFMDWLEADDAHLDQYEAAKADQAALASLRGAFDTDLSRLRGQWRGRGREPRRLLVTGGLAAAGVAALVLAAPLLTPVGPVAQTYSSAPGQITDVVLSDGSRVTLDAGSSIRVAMAEDARRVTLTQGTAFFEVAHDRAHPFQVSVGDRNVIVTGTRFETALRNGGGEVSLLDGQVLIGLRDVAARRAGDRTTRLAPGDRVVFKTGVAGETLARVDVETATAWRKRRLVFRDAPLAEVIAATGRYVDRLVIADDPRLAGLRVTTVLPLDGQGTLLDRMDGLLPITVEPTPQGAVVIRAE